METNRKQIWSVLGSFWSRVWQQGELVSGLVTGLAPVQEQERDIWGPMPGILSRRDLPDKLHYRWRVVDLPVSGITRRVVEVGEFTVGDGTLVGQESPVPPRYHSPLGYESVALIVDRPDSPTIVWQHGADFALDADGLDMFSDPTEAGFELVPTVDSTGETSQSVRMWLCHVDIDIRTPQDTFGLPLGLRFPSSAYYIRLLNAAWDCRIDGLSEANMHRLLSGLVDADVAKLDGEVISTWTENNRVWVNISGILHSAPSASMVVPGDAVKEGDLLFQGCQIYGKGDVIPEDILPGYRMSGGMLAGHYPGGLIFPNREVELTVEDRDVDGETVQLPIFSIGGSDASIAAFRTDMAERIARYGVDLWGIMTEGKSPPLTVNPFEFVREQIFGNNWMLAVLDASSMGPLSITGAFLNQLFSSIPKGTALLIFLVGSATLEEVTGSSITESDPEPFLVADNDDEAEAKAEERMLGGRGIF